MLNDYFNGVGVTVLFLLIFIPTYFLFKKKTFGVFDPLNFFLATRITPLLIALIFISTSYEINYYSILFILSSSVFIITLYLGSPKIKTSELEFSSRSLRFLFFAAVSIVLFKIIILVSTLNDLPIFSESGSDSYISFDENNKISSSFLLGMGASDIVLLTFLYPLQRKKIMRYIISAILFISIIIILANGKKASFLSILLAVSLGEYLRISYMKNKEFIFLTKTTISFLLLFAVTWAVWTYSKTHEIEYSSYISDTFTGINFALYQWAYPFFLFSSTELSSFFDSYQVNKTLYFFHSILSPLGFPAFQSAIGTSIHEFQTGNLTGNGINPTFIIEGYVLFGYLMPIHAFMIATIINIGRSFILRIRSLRNRILVSSLILPMLYELPIDHLLFMKKLWVISLLFLIIYLIGKIIYYENPRKYR